MKARFNKSEKMKSFRMKADGYLSHDQVGSGVIHAIEVNTSATNETDSVSLKLECGDSRFILFLTRADMDTLCVSWLSGLRDVLTINSVTCPYCDYRGAPVSGDPEKLEPQNARVYCAQCGSTFYLKYVIATALVDRDRKEKPSAP